MNNITRIILSLLFVLSAKCLVAQDHVTLKNGEIIEGEIVENKTKNPWETYPFITVNGEKYRITKINSYKKGNSYKVNFKNAQFREADIHGKINAFYVEVQAGHLSNSGSDREFYMIQKGEDGKLETMTWKNLKEMISDNTTAMEKFNSTEKGREFLISYKNEKKLRETMKEIIELYNL